MALSRKNLALYSPVGAWLVVRQVTWVQIEFEVPIVLN